MDKKFDLIADGCIDSSGFAEVVFNELENSEKENVLCLYYDIEIEAVKGDTYESILEKLKNSA